MPEGMTKLIRQIASDKRLSWDQKIAILKYADHKGHDVKSWLFHADWIYHTIADVAPTTPNLFWRVLADLWQNETPAELGVNHAHPLKVD